MNRYDYLDKLLHRISMLISFLALLILILVVVFIFNESLPFISSEFVKTISSIFWRPLSEPPSFGLRTMILGTLYIGFLASILALPLSIGCASCICCYLKGKRKRMILGLMDMLAGIPSVVYGLLGYYTIVRLLERTGLIATGESIFAATITLTVMIMPYMISGYAKVFDDSNAIYGLQTQALGVSKWYFITHLTLAHVKGNILTGYLIALSKALGETMAVMMVVGNSPIVPKLFGKGITISGLIALEMGAARLDSLHYHSLYAAGIILLFLLLAINYFVRKIEGWMKKS